MEISDPHFVQSLAWREIEEEFVQYDKNNFFSRWNVLGHDFSINGFVYVKLVISGLVSRSPVQQILL